MGISKIAVDLTARSFEIEVPDERIDEVLAKLEDLFRLPIPVRSAQAAQASDVVETDAAGEDGAEIDKGKDPPKRRRTNAKGPSKVRAYQLVELELSTEQRAAVRTNFDQRAPTGQNEQVAVLAVKLQELLNRSEFSVDEIHSAFKIVDKPTPKNLIAVFGNMKRDGRGNYSENKFVVNSHTQDYVNYHMGKKAKGKA